MTDVSVESTLKRAVARLGAELRPTACVDEANTRVIRLRDLMPHASHRRYRCIVEYDKGSKLVVFAKKAPQKEYRNLRRLYDKDDLRIQATVPRPLGYIPDIQYLLLEHIEGRTLMNVLVMDCLGFRGRATTTSLHRSAQALAQLQNATGPEEEPYYDSHRLDELEQELELTAYFEPADLARLKRQLENLRPFVERTPAVLSHGEFGPRNIIVIDNQRLALIDWPHLAIHNVFYDAHMFLNSLMGLERIFPWCRRRLENLALEFRQSYLASSELVSDPSMFETARLVNRIELLLRSHRRLRNARNWRVLNRAKNYIRHQTRGILSALSDSRTAP